MLGEDDVIRVLTYALYMPAGHSWPGGGGHARGHALSRPDRPRHLSQGPGQRLRGTGGNLLAWRLAARSGPETEGSEVRRLMQASEERADVQPEFFCRLKANTPMPEILMATVKEGLNPCRASAGR